MHACCRAAPAFVMVLCILAAGCLHTVPGSTGTPAAAPAGATPQAVPPFPGDTCPRTPGPFQTLPPYDDVSITVDRNTVTNNPAITVRFDGGQGLGRITGMTVTVIRSDCVTEQEMRERPGIGTSVTLMGTTKTDRVIVLVTTTSGGQYTVIDAMYPFPPRS